MVGWRSILAPALSEMTERSGVLPVPFLVFLWCRGGDCSLPGTGWSFCGCCICIAYRISYIPWYYSCCCCCMLRSPIVVVDPGVSRVNMCTVETTIRWCSSAYIGTVIVLPMSPSQLSVPVRRVIQRYIVSSSILHIIRYYFLGNVRFERFVPAHTRIFFGSWGLTMPYPHPKRLNLSRSM